MLRWVLALCFRSKLVFLLRNWYIPRLKIFTISSFENFVALDILNNKPKLNIYCYTTQVKHLVGWNGCLVENNLIFVNIV